MKFNSIKIIFAAAAATALVAFPAVAQDTDGWSGEGSFSAGSTTGNTETTDLGLGIALAKKTGVWTYGLDADADYGEIDGFESRNRFRLGGNVDRQINDRLFGFGQASYENDQFSGYDSRIFIGGGLGYNVIENAATKWDVRGGPGIKIDEVKQIVDNTVAPAVIIPAETQNSFGITASSNFSHAFNDAVTLTNDTDVLYAEESTQLGNVIALTAKLSDALSARVSFDVRHDTNPPLGFEDTDTATKVAIVYGFGK
jgi:putative salt-induced outer membrane protein